MAEGIVLWTGSIDCGPLSEGKAKQLLVLYTPQRQQLAEPASTKLPPGTVGLPNFPASAGGMLDASAGGGGGGGGERAGTVCGGGDHCGFAPHDSVGEPGPASLKIPSGQIFPTGRLVGGVAASIRRLDSRRRLPKVGSSFQTPPATFGV